MKNHLIGSDFPGTELPSINPSTRLSSFEFEASRVHGPARGASSGSRPGSMLRRVMWLLTGRGDDGLGPA